MLEVSVKTFPFSKINLNEVKRYAGIINGDKCETVLENEINGVIEECLPKLKYSVCYTETPIKITDNVVDFGISSVESKSLSTHLLGCDSAVIFASTIGLDIDRLIYKYGKISPVKSLILQAFGTERIESLCDDFCEFIAKEKKEAGLSIKSRFSAGYGDFPLSFQKDIFNLLKPENKIMLTLNESLIMSPSKSVTAVIGVGKRLKCEDVKCESCSKSDCLFRSK